MDAIASWCVTVLEKWTHLYFSLLGALLLLQLWLWFAPSPGEQRVRLSLTRGEAADLRALLDDLLAKNPRPMLIDQLVRVRDRLGREG